MIEVAPFESLGRFENAWLSARYHFSFAGYVDPARMGFGPLRVWNDDTIQPGGGFPPHDHKEMEIITYVRRGAITHADSLGNRGRIAAGEVQVMSAGTGITHSEYNHEDEVTELFQIWVEPSRRGLPCRWQSARFPGADREGGLVALAAGPSAPGETARIHQDAVLYGATLRSGQAVRHRLGPRRRAYLVAAGGRLALNGVGFRARDGVAVTGVSELNVEAFEKSALLLFDLP